MRTVNYDQIKKENKQNVFNLTFKNFVSNFDTIKNILSIERVITNDCNSYYLLTCIDKNDQVLLFFISDYTFDFLEFSNLLIEKGFHNIQYRNSELEQENDLLKKFVFLIDAIKIYLLDLLFIF